MAGNKEGVAVGFIYRSNIDDPEGFKELLHSDLKLGGAIQHFFENLFASNLVDESFDLS
jgi:hypothetical protein